MGLEPTENPTIQETLEEMGEIEKEEIEEKQLYKDTIDFDKTGGTKVEVITEHDPSDEEIFEAVLDDSIEEHVKDNLDENGELIQVNQDSRQLIDADVLNPMISVANRVVIATRVADALKSVLESQNLIQTISGNNYVTVSGWSTLGTMIGIRVDIISVEPFPTKARYGYKAKVELVDGRGNKVGEGEAIATSSGRQKEEHAVYSMAITRAVGKAFRLSLAWIMELAGYSSTPYEEMPEAMINNNH
ncbi:MAG: hypothetical protein IJG09_11180 [Methanobrevibacter sp.]|nr:hypothetical protein [Methanobrevibacter sp.]